MEIHRMNNKLLCYSRAEGPSNFLAVARTIKSAARICQWVSMYVYNTWQNFKELDVDSRCWNAAYSSHRRLANLKSHLHFRHRGKQTADWCRENYSHVHFTIAKIELEFTASELAPLRSTLLRENCESNFVVLFSAILLLVFLRWRVVVSKIIDLREKKV